MNQVEAFWDNVLQNADKIGPAVQTSFAECAHLELEGEGCTIADPTAQLSEAVGKKTFKTVDGKCTWCREDRWPRQ